MDTRVQGIAEHFEELWSLLLKAVEDVDDTLLQWALLHCLEHLGYHRGQVLLLLRLGRGAMSGTPASR